MFHLSLPLSPQLPTPQTLQTLHNHNLQAEELAALKLEAGASKAGAESLGALVADHQAEVATNRSEVGLIQAILKAQVRLRLVCGFVRWGLGPWSSSSSHTNTHDYTTGGGQG